MPQTINLPYQQKWYEQALAQTGNFLWNMASAKIQQNIAAKQSEIEHQRAESLVKLKGEEARKTETLKAKVAPRPARAVTSYTTPEGEIAYLPNTIIPPPGWKPYSKDFKEAHRAVQMPDGSVQWISTQDKPPPGSKPYMPPTVQFVGTDPQGNPLMMQTKGDKPGTVTPIQSETKIRPKLGRLPSESQKMLVDLQSVGDSVKKVAEAFSPDFVGPIKGRKKAFLAKFKGDPKFTRFQKTLGQLRAVVYGLSGKQINESELQWLKDEILPQLENPGANFQETLLVLDDWITSKYSNVRTAFSEEGYTVGGPEKLQSLERPKQTPEEVEAAADAYLNK